MREAITVEQCSQAVIEGLEKEEFLILPHKEVADFIVKKASNYDQWLRLMSGLRQKILVERNTRQNN